MMNLGNVSNAVSNYYGNEAARGIKNKDVKDAKGASRTSETAAVRKASEAKTSGVNVEDKLSDRAKDFLKNLREANEDMDFYVGNNGDDLQGLMSGSTKDVSVAFSVDEIEKMAADEEYANGQLDKVRNAVETGKSISEQFDFEGKGIDAKIGISFDDDGNMKIFADLERISEKQRERLEKEKEETKKADKEDDKTAARGKDANKLDAYGRNNDNTVQKMRLEASSEDELIEQLQNLDWSKATKEEYKFQGIKFDLSV